MLKPFPKYQLTEACVFKRLPSVFSCTSYELKAPYQNLFWVNALSFHQKSSQMEKAWQRTQVSRAQVCKNKINKSHWTTLFPLQLLLYLQILSIYKLDKSRKQNKTKNQPTTSNPYVLLLKIYITCLVSCHDRGGTFHSHLLGHPISPAHVCTHAQTPGSSQFILAIQQYVGWFL